VPCKKEVWAVTHSSCLLSFACRQKKGRRKQAAIASMGIDIPHFTVPLPFALFVLWNQYVGSGTFPVINLAKFMDFEDFSLSSRFFSQ
jgi:hypothetical protein